MITTSSNHLQGLHFRRDDIPANRNLAGESSQLSKLEGESVIDQASNYEEPCPSEHGMEFEEVLEEEVMIIRDKQESLDSNPNPYLNLNLNFNFNSSPLDDGSHRGDSVKSKMRRQKAMQKALDEFRFKLENALQDSTFLGHLHKEGKNQKMEAQNLKDITLWGVPLLPSKGHEATNTILLKFLRAQDCKASEALEMLRQTLIWRKQEGIDHILEEKLEVQIKNDLSKVIFTDSVDKEGHPLCFNLYGAFKDKEVYHKAFGSDRKREEFLRWRIQLMEKSIKKLNFNEGGVNSFLFISDMKNVAGPGARTKELSHISKDAVSLFQRHYPELIFKHIIINTAFWYYLLHHRVIAQYCTHGTKRKFVFARSHRVIETLLKYIPPQNIPIQYGGLRRENDEEFNSADEPQEFTVRAGGVFTFQIPISEGKVTVVWEVMVVGWQVTYQDEFIPYDEGSYNISLRKKKIHGESVRNSFYVNEPGNILITIKNPTYIKKKAYIRHKTKVTLPMYQCTTQQTTS